MVASSRPSALPVRVYLYVTAVLLTALLLLPFSRWTAGAVQGSVALVTALLLITFIAAAYQRPIELGPKRKVNVGTAAEVAAVLLLPGPLAVLTLAVGSVVGE